MTSSKEIVRVERKPDILQSVLRWFVDFRSGLHFFILPFLPAVTFSSRFIFFLFNRNVNVNRM